MNSTDRNFTGSIPALYDRYLGPLIFEPYAADIATRLSYLTSGALLETAAGTGIVTRALIKALADDIRLIATDLNEAMIDYAARQVASPGLSWQKVDAINLPFENASFDAVVCQFGVMFFPDRVSAYREAARVLKPGGRFIFNVWDRIEENDFAYRVSCAMKNLFPQDPPMFLSRTPYGHADLRTIQCELEEAGFKPVKIETISRRSQAGSARVPAIGFCQGSPLRSEIEARDASVQKATDAATAAIAAQFSIGPVDGHIQAHVIEAAT